MEYGKKNRGYFGEDDGDDVLRPRSMGGGYEGAYRDEDAPKKEKDWLGDIGKAIGTFGESMRRRGIGMSRRDRRDEDYISSDRQMKENANYNDEEETDKFLVLLKNSMR